MALAAKQVAVEQEVDQQQGQSHDEHGQEHVRRGPKEVDALQKTEEQRRIAQGREGPPDVGDEKDEEYDRVNLMLAPVVGAQDRADQQHCGAGRAHETGEDGPHRQDGRVDGRSPSQGSLQPNAASDRKKRQQQDDEGDVLQDRDVNDLEERQFPAENESEGDQKGQGPEGGDLTEIAVPPDRGDKRKDRDRQQDADEGHIPDEGQDRPLQVRSSTVAAARLGGQSGGRTP